MNNHKDCTKMGNLRDIRQGLAVENPSAELAFISLINRWIGGGRRKEADGHSEREVDTPVHPPNVYL